MRVLIVGGGIGGLALAQGLKTHGVEALVFERDDDLTNTGGYKLHLGSVACESLRQVLSTELWETVCASAVQTDGFEIAVRDYRARFLAAGTDDQPGESLDIDRITLRQILAVDLRSRLRTGSRCTAFRETSEGVEVTLSTGEKVAGDFLVLADGARSSLLHQLEGAAKAKETGLVGVAGRTQASDLGPSALKHLRTHPMLAIGPDGVGMFASLHAPGTGPRSMAVTQAPVVIWGVITVAEQLPVRLDRLDGEELKGLVVGLLKKRGWSTDLSSIVDTSIAPSVAGFQFLATDPTNIASWKPGPVTAIGDAAHAMPPTGGRGAATAIQDAAVLTILLAQVEQGQATLDASMQTHMSEMRSYAPQAVQDSLQPVRWIKASADPLGKVVCRIGLPILAGLVRIKKRLKGD